MATQAIDLDELARMHSKDECPLDFADRYLIVPDGGDEVVPHTRTTTGAKTLDEGWGLTPWEVRTSALGFAMNPILFARLCALVPDLGADPDKKALDALCKEAKKHAGGDDARDNGTVLHAFSEKVDKGQSPPMPDAYRADIDAYRAKLDELEIRIVPEYVERYVVLPADLLGEPVAGKCDRFVHFGSTLKTFDLKCGGLGPWNWLAWSIQLATYSRVRTFYNARTKSHEPVPEIDQDIGIICHLPAGAARCDIYFVDLTFGWKAAQLAYQVRALRKEAKSGGVAEAWDPDVAIHNRDVRRARLVERIAELKAVPGALEALVAIWPPGIPTFKQSTSHTPAELDLIAMAISTAEARTRAPFGAPDPADTPATRTQEQP